MRLVGIKQHGTEAVDVATLNDDGSTVTVVAGLADFWANAEAHIARGGTDTLHTRDVTIVPPVLPGARVICIGLNYLEHASEGSYRSDPLPEFPTLFARWSTSLTVGGDAVAVPSDEDGLDWEGEVMAWVGAELSDATSHEALAAVVGYSTFNDLTARRAQKLTSQWILGKNADRSGPVGPLVPAAEVGDLRDGLRITTRVNGDTVQDACTDQMIYTVGDTLAHISRTFTINPGDLLATGTPSGVGYVRTPPWLLHAGDTVEVEVEKLGILRNTIAHSRSRAPGVE